MEWILYLNVVALNLSEMDSCSNSSGSSQVYIYTPPNTHTPKNTSLLSFNPGPKEPLAIQLTNPNWCIPWCPSRLHKLSQKEISIVLSLIISPNFLCVNLLNVSANFTVLLKPLHTTFWQINKREMCLLHKNKLTSISMKTCLLKRISIVYKKKKSHNLNTIGGIQHKHYSIATGKLANQSSREIKKMKYRD